MHRRGREATAEDRRARVESWQAIRLHWIAPHLTGERRASYEKMSADWETPDVYDFHYYSLPAEHGWRSPISAEELTGLTLTDALDKISAWQPSKRQTNVIGEGTEGLAVAFGQYVSGNAEELSGQADVLERREPVPIYVYVRTFIEQMAEAVKAARKIDLAAVLRLCKWVVEQPLAGYGGICPLTACSGSSLTGTGNGLVTRSAGSSGQSARRCRTAFRSTRWKAIVRRLARCSNR